MPKIESPEKGTDVNRPDRAKANFSSGYNCAQAVFLAFADLYGLDQETAAKLTIGLGGGIGRLREVCGAVSAAALLIGLDRGPAEVGDDEAKAALYEEVQNFAARFKAEEGSIVCRDLLGLDQDNTPPQPDKRTPAYYEERPCSRLVWLAAHLFEEIRGGTATNTGTEGGSPVVTD